MRNLKRALSLGLTAAMISGLMVMGSSAVSYPDSDQIQNQTAVEILGEIGVMVGDDNGNFNPTQDVTRAEMAVIITRILYGNDLNVDQFKGMNLFTDVPAWAEGFVNLCASLDIVAGVGDGKFAPNETVTAAQAALMLSRALGYFQNNAEFGNDWALAAIRRATSAGIIGDDMVLAANEGLSRDNVAQMTFNTLTKAVPVQYNELLNVYYNENQGITYALTFNYLQTLGYTNFDLVYDNGDTTIYGRPATTWGIGSYRTTTSDKDSGSRYDEALDANGGLISSNVQILSRDEIITIANEPTYTYTDGTAEEDIYDDLGDARCNDQRGQAAEDEYDWTVYVNGELQDVSDEDAIPAENEGDPYAYTDEGARTEIYVDDADKTVTVVEINYYLGQVANVNDGTTTVRAISDLGDTKLDVRTFATSEFAEDDYVIFTIDQNADDDFYICELTAPETVDGTVTRVNKNADSSDAYLYLDSETKYDYSSHMVYDLNDANNVQHPSLEEDYTLFLDPNGYVLAYSGDVTKSFLYVQDSDEELADWEARVVLADGTDDVIMVDGDLDNGEDAAINFNDPDEVEWADNVNDLANFPNWVDSTELNGWNDIRGKITDIDYQIWEYDTNADGDLYTLTGRNTKYQSGVQINNGQAYIRGEKGFNDVTIDNSTIFVDVDSNTTWTGYSNVPDVSNANIAYVLKNDSDRAIAEIVYIIEGDIYDADAIFFVLTSADRDTVKYDGDLYFEFDDTYVDGYSRDGLYVSYEALIESGYLGGINSLDEDDQDADDDRTVAEEIEDELVGRIIEVRKSIDGTYVTEIRVHPMVEYDPAVAVSSSALDVAEWWLENNWNENKYTTDSDTIYVVVEEEYNRNLTEMTGYDVSEGTYRDIVEWTDENYNTDRDGYTTLVNVVKEEDQNANLVYIWKFLPEYYQREVTVNLNGVEIDSQNLWWWSDSIDVTDVNAVAALNRAQANGSHLSYTVTYGDVTTGTATVPADYDILIPAASEDTVVNVTSDNVNIEVNGNLTLDTLDPDDDAIGAYSIDMDAAGSIRYGFQIDEIPDGYTVESITWDETIVRNGYVASNKEGKVAYPSDISVVLGRNIVYASAVATYASTDTVTVYVTDAVVNLKAVEPVVDTYTLTIADNYADIRRDLNFFIDGEDAEDAVERVNTPDGTTYTLEVPENAEVMVTRHDGTSFGNQLYYYNGVVVEKNGNKVIIDSMTNDVVLGNELDTKCAVEAVELVNGVEAKLASGQPETNLVDTIDNTLYVKSGAKLTVTVPEDAGTGYLVNAISGNKQASGTDQTISADTKLYAAVNVKQKDVYVYYEDLAGATQTHNGSDLAVGTELTFSLDEGATKNQYGTSVIDTKNGNAVLEDGVKVGTKDMAPNGAFTVNFTGMTVTADGKTIESGDKVVKGATLACVVDTDEGEHPIVLNKDSQNLGTLYTPGAVNSDLNLTAGVQLDIESGISVTLAGGKAPITGDTTYAVKGTELEVVVGAGETVTVNGNEVSTPDGVANITVGNVDMTINKK